MKQVFYLLTFSFILISIIFLSIDSNNYSNQTYFEPNATWENKHVLIIGIDGMRSDAFREATKPNMDALLASGAVTYDAYAGGELSTTTQQATSSGPGWSSILTGVWIDKHGVSNNSFSGHDFANYPHFFSRLYDLNNNANLSSIVHWSPIDSEIIGNSSNNANFFRSTQSSDADITTAAVSHLANTNPDVLFLHYDELDGVGHGSGFSVNNASYMNKITEIDFEIGQVIAAVEARPNYATEDWLYIVVTDHGGNGTSHGGQSYDERRIPMVVSGGAAVNQEIFPGPGHHSVPAIVAQHLGVTIDPNWGWDGPTFGFTVSNSTLDTNLIGCFNLDNNLNDSSTENNNGIPSGSPNYVTGKIGTALQLDGVDDYVSLGSPAEFNFGNDTDFSIACWVKNLNGGSDPDGVIIGNKDWDDGNFSGWVIADGTSTPNSWQWNIGDNSNRDDYDGASNGIGDNDNIWHHIAISHHRNEFAVIYLDGNIVGWSNITDIGNISSGLPTVIGADATLNDYFLNGQIDDVSIWNRRLSETEINSIISSANSGISVCQATLSTTNQDLIKTKIYPNPSKDILYYDSVFRFSEIIVYDLNAKEIMKLPFSTTKKFIDTSVLSEGVYIIKFVSDNRTETFNFIKTNH